MQRSPPTCATGRTGPTRQRPLRPPLWTPDKDLCPTGMTVAERRNLMATSVPANEEAPRSRRFALRRTEHGLGARARGLPMVFVTEHGHD
jgi:hypothetical protein